MTRLRCESCNKILVSIGIDKDAITDSVRMVITCECGRRNNYIKGSSGKKKPNITYHTPRSELPFN
jgi:RNase P subunit RPR2